MSSVHAVSVCVCCLLFSRYKNPNVACIVRWIFTRRHRFEVVTAPPHAAAEREMPLSTRSVAATNAIGATERAPKNRSTAKTTASATTTRSTATPKTAATTAASCSTAAATSASGAPSRIQVLREARKAAAERERACEALVDAANLRRNPLKELSVQRAFRSNGLDAALEWQRGAALSDDELLFCTALLSANMRAQAKAAGWGWSDAAKRRALRDDQSRVLLIRSRGAVPELPQATGEEACSHAGTALGVQHRLLGFVLLQLGLS